jgi:hypothetical protein
MRDLRRVRAWALSAILLATAGMFWTSCGSAETAFDCEQVCTKYRDCYNTSYDVGMCEDRCRSAAANDATVKSKADACESCIDGMSCAGATFNCTQDCSAIVP